MSRIANGAVPDDRQCTVCHAWFTPPMPAPVDYTRLACRAKAGVS